MHARKAPSFIGLVAALICGPIWAADSQSADSNDASGEMMEVVVTGSRIPVPGNVSSTSPIQVLSSQEIEQQGQTDTINLLNRLPQTLINPGVDIGNNSAPLA